MAIRQRKDRGGRWQVYYRNPLTGKQETALYDTKKEAQKADDEIRLRLKWEPESFKPQEAVRETKEVLTFEAVTDLYLKYRQFSRVSLTNLLYAIKPFMPIIGPYDITQIGRKELVQALNLIDNGKVKATTVHRKFSIIKAIMGFALRRGYIDSLPPYPELPKKTRPAIIPPTQEEIERLYRLACPHLQRVILLGSKLGLRVGQSEMLKLKWSDFDFNRNVLVLRAANKNKAEPIREIPLKQSIIPILKEWRADGCEYVVHYGKKPIGKVAWAWWDLIERAGFEHHQFRPYDLRHAFATDAIAGGADIGTVSRLMGHANVTITIATYQHVTTSQKVAAIESLPDIKDAQACMHKVGRIRRAKKINKLG